MNQDQATGGTENQDQPMPQSRERDIPRTVCWPRFLLPIPMTIPGYPRPFEKPPGVDNALWEAMVELERKGIRNNV